MNEYNSIDWLIDAYRKRQTQTDSPPDCVALIEKLQDPAKLKELIAESGGDIIDPLIPKEFGDFTILGPIGSGGMGQVFRVRHKKLDRIQALKLLPPHRIDNQQARLRFEREMRAVGKLSHPNIVVVHDAGVIDGTPFLAMELIDGKSLAELSREHRRQDTSFSVEVAVELITQAGNGLRHAHQNNVLHRDIKPANLMLDQDGVVKVLDLGLAKINSEGGNPVPNPESIQVTADQQILGTPDFMAPEQIMGKADERTDIYALGATLYFLLTGKVLYPSANRSLLHKALAITNEPVPELIKNRSDVPESLKQVVARSISKTPDRRQQTIEEFIDEVRSSVSSFIETSTQQANTSTEVTHAVEHASQRNNDNTPNKQNPTANPANRSQITFQREKPLWKSFVNLALACGLLAVVIVPIFWNKKGAPQPTVTNEIDFPFEVEYLSKKFPDLEDEDPSQVHLREGLIGDSVFTTKFSDFVKINLDLDAPSYFYLVALNPTENSRFRIQLCLPSGEDEIPRADTTISFPTDELSLYQLSDGEGQLAFVLLVSEAPLPSFEEWKAKNLDGLPWQVSVAPHVWSYSKSSVLKKLLPSRDVRCEVIQTRNDVVESCTRFLEGTAMDHVYWLSFPVAKD